MSRLARRYLPPTIVLVAMLGIWQALVEARHVPDYLLPGPLSIWRTARAEQDVLLPNTVPTIEEAVVGFGLAALLGLLTALAIRYSPLLERTIYPLVIASQTLPVLALAPVLVILLGFTVLPKLIVVCLICFFPITVNAVDGFKSADPDLLNLMRTFGAGRWTLFRQVEWPAALPSIFSGLKVAVTFSVVGALFGEWVGSSEGLGWYMIQAKAQFDTAGVFAAMILLTVIGISLFAVVALAERLLLPWYHNDERRSALFRRP